MFSFSLFLSLLLCGKSRYASFPLPPLIRTMLFPQSVKQGQTDPRGRPNKKERERELFSVSPAAKEEKRGDPYTPSWGLLLIERMIPLMGNGHIWRAHFFSPGKKRCVRSYVCAQRVTQPCLNTREKEGYATVGLGECNVNAPALLFIFRGKKVG